MNIACRTHGEKINAYTFLTGKAEGERQLGRSRSMWEDISTMDFRELGWDGMDWIDLAWDGEKWRALMITLMNVLAQ
jgi:hypothetical protein